jgi:hypothetical protein
MVLVLCMLNNVCLCTVLSTCEYAVRTNVKRHMYIQYDSNSHCFYSTVDPETKHELHPTMYEVWCHVGMWVRIFACTVRTKLFSQKIVKKESKEGQ